MRKALMSAVGAVFVCSLPLTSHAAAIVDLTLRIGYAFEVFTPDPSLDIDFDAVASQSVKTTGAGMANVSVTDELVIPDLIVSEIAVFAKVPTSKNGSARGYAQVENTLTITNTGSTRTAPIFDVFAYFEMIGGPDGDGVGTSIDVPGRERAEVSFSWFALCVDTPVGCQFGLPGPTVLLEDEWLLRNGDDTNLLDPTSKFLSDFTQAPLIAPGLDPGESFTHSTFLRVDFAVVPEPTGLLPLVMGLAGLGFVVHRRRHVTHHGPTG